MREKVHIEVGLGVTYTIGSDRYPKVVSKIISDRKIEVRSVKYTHFYGGNYMIHLDEPYGDTVVLTYRKNGRWVEQGQGLYSGGSYFIGHADLYRDPSF